MFSMYIYIYTHIYVYAAGSVSNHSFSRIMCTIQNKTNHPLPTAPRRERNTN